MPTRSSVEAWDVSHLEDAAQHWRRTALKWEIGFDDLHRGSYTAGGDTFSGAGAEALQDSTARSSLLATNNAMDLNDAAGRAQLGAEDIHYAKQQVLSSIAAAEDEGFTVGEDFSVTDNQPSGGLLADEQRKVQAATHAGNISSQVTSLVATDEQVAGRVASGFQPTDYKLSPPPTLPSPVPSPAGSGPPLPFATPRPNLPAGPPLPASAVNDFYKGIAAQEPCVTVADTAPDPGAWEKLTTPAPGVSQGELGDAWSTYIGAAGGFGLALADSPPLAAIIAATALKPNFDGLLKAYGVAP